MQALKSSLVARSQGDGEQRAHGPRQGPAGGVTWKVLANLPCTVELMKVSNVVVKLCEFGQYKLRRSGRPLRRAQSGAGPARRRCGPSHGGRSSPCAGATLTSGDGRSSFTKPSGKASWTFPRVAREGRSMTQALAAALQRARHLRGERVLYRDSGTPIVHATLRAWLEACERRAGLEVQGLPAQAPSHVLLAPGDARRAGQGDRSTGDRREEQRVGREGAPGMVEQRRR